MLIETLTTWFKMIEVQLGVGAVLVLLLVWLIVYQLRLKKLKQRMNEYETRYNHVKSVPLAFKLNKAVALARVNGDILKHVNEFKNGFEDITENIKSIAYVLAETEDALVLRKLKTAKLNLLDLSGMLSQVEKQVDGLNTQLDNILEEENQQRGQITELKEIFRMTKQDMTARTVQLAKGLPYLEEKSSEIEKAFTSFEEWMYASEFHKAKEKMEEIRLSLDELKGLIKDLPELLSIAYGVIPKQIQELKEYHAYLNQREIMTSHLDVNKNLALVEETTEQNQIRLSNGQVYEVEEYLRDNKKRLEQLKALMMKEEQSAEEIATQWPHFETTLIKLKSLHQSLMLQLQKDAGRFGWEDLDELLNEKQKALVLLEKDHGYIAKLLKDKDHPASAVNLKMKEWVQASLNIQNDLNAASDQLSSARSDEERARNQLLKLQLIVSEIQFKIRKFKLPVISKQYETDVMQSHQYVSSIDKLLKDPVIDIKLLNATVNDAIDYIYKLYNNVNNLIGTAEMVENAIVYGNKYRSLSPQVDTLLTRSELLYRNGDYTQALKYSIEAVESVQPHHFDGLIKENAKSVSE